VGVWKTKIKPHQNQVPVVINVGDDTSVQLERSGEGVITVKVMAPREKTIVRNGTEPVKAEQDA